MFDPYHKWLGIAKDQRPPTHYQLLAIPSGETDAEVIEEAAIRQSTHVRAYQLGEHASDSTKLLNEIALAKATLLNAAKRMAYDDSLARQQAIAATKNAVESATVIKPPAANKSVVYWLIGGIVTAVVLLAALIVALLMADRHRRAEIASSLPKPALIEVAQPKKNGMDADVTTTVKEQPNTAADQVKKEIPGKSVDDSKVKVDKIPAVGPVKKDGPIEPTQHLVPKGESKVGVGLNLAAKPFPNMKPPSDRKGDWRDNLAGKWRVKYTDGSVRTYEIKDDGSVHFREEDLSGRFQRTSNYLLLAFVQDTRLERIYPSQRGSLLIDQYSPRTTYPKGKPFSFGEAVRLSDPKVDSETTIAGGAGGTTKPVEPITVGKSQYLSDMTEYEVKVAEGRFAKKGDLGYNAGNPARSRIAVNGKESPNGLSMHAISNGVAVVKYRLRTKGGTFMAAAALNDSAGGAGLPPGVGKIPTPLTFQIVGDGKVLWSSDPIDRARVVYECKVDVNGVDVLELRVVCPGSHVNAQAVWLEPRVLTK